MSESPPPEFGPNGAVLNSPSMTDDMRAQIAGTFVEPERPESFAWMFWLQQFIFGWLFVFGWFAGILRQTPVSSWIWAAAAHGLVLGAVAFSPLSARVRNTTTKWMLFVPFLIASCAVLRIPLYFAGSLIFMVGIMGWRLRARRSRLEHGLWILLLGLISILMICAVRLG